MVDKFCFSIVENIDYWNKFNVRRVRLDLHDAEKCLRWIILFITMANVKTAFLTYVKIWLKFSLGWSTALVKYVENSALLHLTLGCGTTCNYVLLPISFEFGRLVSTLYCSTTDRDLFEGSIMRVTTRFKSNKTSTSPINLACSLL